MDQFLGELPLTRPWPALVALVVVLIASVAVFWVLVRRWTTHRLRLQLADWAASNRFKLDPPGAERLPEPVADAKTRGKLLFSLRDDSTSLVQLEAGTTPGEASDKPACWNLLVRKIGTAWPLTGLRPVSHKSSFLDAFVISSYPSLASPDRFVVFGADAVAARAVGGSSLVGLTPAVVGLLLHGGYLILDFSTRPFDTIEVQRMIGIVDQLAAHLPAKS